jgi:hypothetical protein
VRKLIKILAVAAVVGAIVVGISLFSLYKASQHVPEFYREAISLDPDEQEPARDEFVAQVTALASDLHRSGHWQSLFTDDQINAWLALELATNYPELLRGELHEPRISIRDKEATIACRYENAQVRSVLSLTVDAYLQEPNVLALRIRKARAGALPVPLAQVLDGISRAALQLNLRLEWRKAKGDPVALVTLPRSRFGQTESLNLQAIELRDGEVFVSGTIGAPRTIESPGGSEPSEPLTAKAAKAGGPQSVVGSAEKETRQK